MNTRAVIHVISFLLIVVGLAMAACHAVALYFADPCATRSALLISACVTLATGLVSWLATRGKHELSWRDGIGIGTLGWFAVTLLGALPYVLSGVGPGLGPVGPLQNYAAIRAGGKIVLIFCMLLGCLEFYTLLALCFPSFWKK